MGRGPRVAGAHRNLRRRNADRRGAVAGRPRKRHRNLSLRASKARADGIGPAHPGGRRGDADRAPLRLRPLRPGSRRIGQESRRDRSGAAHGARRRRSRRRPVARHGTARPRQRRIVVGRLRQGQCAREGSARACARRGRPECRLLVRDDDRDHRARPRPDGRIARRAANRAIRSGEARQRLPPIVCALPDLAAVSRDEAAAASARGKPAILRFRRGRGSGPRDGEGADGRVRRNGAPGQPGARARSDAGSARDRAQVAVRRRGEPRAHQSRRHRAAAQEFQPGARALAPIARARPRVRRRRDERHEQGESRVRALRSGQGGRGQALRRRRARRLRAHRRDRRDRVAARRLQRVSGAFRRLQGRARALPPRAQALR